MKITDEMIDKIADYQHMKRQERITQERNKDISYLKKQIENVSKKLEDTKKETDFSDAEAKNKHNKKIIMLGHTIASYEKQIAREEKNLRTELQEDKNDYADKKGHYSRISSLYYGLLIPGNHRFVDNSRSHLPTLISRDNYNNIILPYLQQQDFAPDVLAKLKFKFEEILVLHDEQVKNYSNLRNDQFIEYYEQRRDLLTALYAISHDITDDFISPHQKEVIRQLCDVEFKMTSRLYRDKENALTIEEKMRVDYMKEFHVNFDNFRLENPDFTLLHIVEFIENQQNKLHNRYMMIMGNSDNLSKFESQLIAQYQLENVKLLGKALSEIQENITNVINTPAATQYKEIELNNIKITLETISKVLQRTDMQISEANTATVLMIQDLHNMLSRLQSRIEKEEDRLKTNPPVNNTHIAQGHPTHAVAIDADTETMQKEVTTDKRARIKQDNPPISHQTIILIIQQITAAINDRDRAIQEFQDQIIDKTQWDEFKNSFAERINKSDRALQTIINHFAEIDKNGRVRNSYSDTRTLIASAQGKLQFAVALKNSDLSSTTYNEQQQLNSKQADSEVAPPTHYQSRLS